MKKKLTYDDIQLKGKVRWCCNGCPLIGEIIGIENNALPDNFSEPVFAVKFYDVIYYFGLKFILKNYIPKTTYIKE